MKCKKGDILASVFVTVISLSVYLYLFAYADRTIVFLYEHLGLNPFDKMTTGRYWMAGLILSGFLSVFYLIYRLIARWIFPSEDVSWLTVVRNSALPLIAGILFITMTFGEPVMPFSIAIGSALALIVGMAIGFSVVDDFLNDVRSTFVYLIGSLGMVPFLMLFRLLELPGKGGLSMITSVTIVWMTLIGGFVWLFLFFRLTKHRSMQWKNVIKGTLAIAYIGLPMLHYFLATPKGIPYITTAENFFAKKMMVRIANWILLVGIVFMVDKLSQKRLSGNKPYPQKDR
jgi:hypothetical protein